MLVVFVYGEEEEKKDKKKENLEEKDWEEKNIGQKTEKGNLKEKEIKEARETARLFFRVRFPQETGQKGKRGGANGERKPE